MPILQLNELAMTYEMGGNGVPLVFLHEVATDHRVWRYQRTYFQPRYHVITIDVLGHGQVAWPERELSIEQAARRVLQLLGRLGTGPAFVIGVSMGAAVAMQLALDAPAQVLGLALVSPWSYTNEHMRSLVDRLFRLAEAGDMRKYMDLFLHFIFPAADPVRPPRAVGWLRALGLEQNPRAVAYAWAACPVVDLGSQLGEIRAPSLVIAGLNDLFTPPYLARAVVEGLSEVEHEVWEGTGHFAFLEKPRRFNRRLEAFIQRCLEQPHRNDGSSRVSLGAPSAKVR